jgi:hypothetical protein
MGKRMHSCGARKHGGVVGMVLGLLWVAAGCRAEDAPGTARLAETVDSTIKLDASCPPPTRDQGGHCVLDADAYISAPLELASSTKLNCKGHRILPVAAGIDGPFGGGYSPSVPEVAVVLIGTHKSKLQNCVIGSPEERFDFGVTILAAKAPAGGRNKVLGNEMHVRNRGVLLLGADDNEIADNDIEWDGSGVGVYVNRDSDRNHIVGNTLTSSDRPIRPVREFPGTNTVTGAGNDVGVFHLDNMVGTTLINVLIGNRLLQFPMLVSGGELLRIEDTVTEFNTITLPGPHVGKNHGGIVTAVLATRTIIRGNDVTGGRPGIRFSGGGAPVLLPKTCSGDASRYCLTDADCNIPGVDEVPLGTCPVLGPVVNLDARAIGALVEGNTLHGPFGQLGPPALPLPQLDCALGPFGGTVGAVVRDNLIFAAGSMHGIILSGEGLLDSVTLAPNSGAIVTRNIIDGARIGLNLRAPLPANNLFGARVSENDIINSLVVAVGSTQVGSTDYAVPSELSVDDQGRVCTMGSTGCRGNFWQHDAAPGFRTTDTNDSDIRDSNPFCQPVAALGGVVPVTCP